MNTTGVVFVPTAKPAPKSAIGSSPGRRGAPAHSATVAAAQASAGRSLPVSLSWRTAQGSSATASTARASAARGTRRFRSPTTPALTSSA